MRIPATGAKHLGTVSATVGLPCRIRPQDAQERLPGRLGYAEPASFNHAFRRWNGTSPRKHRQRQRDQHA
jgi:hypothetical protein